MKPQDFCSQMFEGMIMFVDSSFQDYKAASDANPGLVGIKQHMFKSSPLNTHADGTPMSACAQYVLWLYPEIKPEDIASIRSKYARIEVMKYDEIIFLFNEKEPLGFFSRQPSNFGSLMSKKEYDVAWCMKSGVTRSTSMAILAFYYLKILPPALRVVVYLNPNFLRIPPIEKKVDPTEFERKDQKFRTEFAAFITETQKRRDRLGVSYVVVDDGGHAQAIVYDAPNKRLEVYDSASSGPLNTYDMNATLYGYFAARAPMLQEQFGICKLYGNGLNVQGPFQEAQLGKRPKGVEDGSCALWATVIAMCRMTDVDRAQLPIYLQDVADTSALIRSVLMTTCGFGTLDDKKHTPQDFDQLIAGCEPSQADAQAILDSILRHTQRTPIVIPPDLEICDPEMKQTEPCTELHLNLNELKLSLRLASYLHTLCPRATRINLQIPDDSALDIDQLKSLYKFDAPGVTFNLILPPGSTLNFDDLVTGHALNRLLVYFNNIIVHTTQATVTNRFVSNDMRMNPFWRRLRVDRILLTEPTSEHEYKQAADLLKNISDNVFGVIERDSYLEWAKASGLDKFVVPHMFEGFPEPTTFISKW
jgi:hypothetical protein